MLKKWSSLFILIPLNISTGWESLTFRKIPPNKVSFSASGLSIDVNGSSSPLIYKFSQTTPTVRVRVQGKKLGSINLTSPQKQGLKGFDDLPLRVGLVLEGNKTLSWAEKLIAAEWIKKMHSLAPPGKGLDHVLFLEVVNDSSLIGIKRNHYLNDILKEEIVSAVQADGTFVIDKTFSEPQKVMGLWLSSSGDHAQSQFKVFVDKIELIPDP